MAQKRKAGETESGMTRSGNIDRETAINAFVQAILDGHKQG